MVGEEFHLDFVSVLILLVIIIGAIVGIVFAAKWAGRNLRKIFQNPGAWIVIVGIIIAGLQIALKDDRLITLGCLVMIVGGIVYAKKR